MRRLLDAQAGEPGRRYALFITNKVQQVAIWRQRKGDESGDGLVVWDYHVVMLSQCDTHGWRVWDYDTVSPFPCAAAAYLIDAFKPAEPILPRYRPVFRVVPADSFIDHFASDRRHMRKRKPASSAAADGGAAATTLAAPPPVATPPATTAEPAPPDADWLAPPPTWPCYRGRLAASDHNLPMCVGLPCLRLPACLHPPPVSTASASPLTSMLPCLGLCLCCTMAAAQVAGHHQHWRRVRRSHGPAAGAAPRG